MAITNGYATLAQLRSELGNYAAADTGDDSKMEMSIEAASRQIDAWCGQRFWIDTSVAARYFTAIDGVVDLADSDFGGIATSTGLIVATDDDNALTYGTTWATTDYRLLPLNAAADGEPWTQLAASPVGAYTWPGTSNSVKITAKFGWPAVPIEVTKACLILANDLLNAPTATFGVAGSNEFGVMRVGSGLNRQAALLLRNFRRPPVG